MCDSRQRIENAPRDDDSQTKDESHDCGARYGQDKNPVCLSTGTSLLQTEVRGDTEMDMKVSSLRETNGPWKINGSGIPTDSESAGRGNLLTGLEPALLPRYVD